MSGPSLSALIWKTESRLVPCRLVVEAIGLSVHPNDAQVPIKE